MKIKSKLKSIIEGYKNLLLEDELLAPLFEQRYNTCLNCPTDDNKMGVCQVCFCVCKAKAYSTF